MSATSTSATIHYNESNTSPTVVVVLCHGFQGSHKDFHRLVAHLVSTFSEKNQSVFILTPTSSEGWPGPFHPTRQGTLACAARAHQELVAVINTHPAATCLSSLIVVGHSFGGVYSRAMLRLLHADHTIPERLTPLGFISVASPHLGIRWRPSVWTSICQFAARTLAGVTGKELLLEDEAVVLLAISSNEYLEALQLFPALYCYGNVFYDVQVPLCTATIRSRNPYHHPSNQRTIPEACYPSIVEPGLAGQETEDEPAMMFSSNLLGDTIRLIHNNLNQLEWTRIDCICGVLHCHNQIIGNHPPFFDTGIDVVVHLSKTIQKLSVVGSN